MCGADGKYLRLIGLPATSRKPFRLRHLRRCDENKVKVSVQNKAFFACWCFYCIFHFISHDLLVAGNLFSLLPLPSLSLMFFLSLETEL